MRRVIWAALLFSLIVPPCHALDVVTSFGPTIDTNVSGRDHYVFDLSLAKSVGKVQPYVSVETLFGAMNGIGSFNPVSAKFGVGIKAKLTPHLYLVVDHYSRHAIDQYRPTEKFTAFKLEHRFTTD